MIDLGNVIVVTAGCAVIGAILLEKYTTAQRHVEVMLEEHTVKFPLNTPPEPDDAPPDEPQWTWRACAKCGYTSPGKALCCPSDGSPMELVTPPDDGAFSAQWIGLEQRTCTDLEEQEAEDALQLEDIHDTIFGRELLDYVLMRRAYLRRVWHEYSDKTTLN